MREQAKASANLSEEQKIDVVADIDSIQDQLAKAHPDKSVVGMLWSHVEKIAVGADLAGAVATVLPAIRAVMS